MGAINMKVKGTPKMYLVVVTRGAGANIKWGSWGLAPGGPVRDQEVDPKSMSRPPKATRQDQ